VFTAPDGGGVRATVAHSAGAPVERWRGPDGSHSPCAVAIKGRGVAVAFVDAAGSVLVRDPRDNSLAECAKAGERARAHAPALAHDGSWWLAVWVSEDTGRFSLCVASAFGTTMRVAEVWAPLDRPWSSAPALALRGGEGAWLAWREERGPRPGVYARGLDRVGRRVGEELRVSDRASRAAPGRVGLAAGAERWCGAYAEETEAGRSRVGLAGGVYPVRG
jgi:hypothetical protein